MKKILLVIMAAAVLLVLAACSNAAADSVVKEVVYPQAIDFDDFESSQAVRESNPLSESFVSAVDDFSYQTTAALLAEKAGQNINYSPLSLYYALSVAACGANGETQQQMLTLLGITDSATLAEQCGNLYRLLYRDNEISQLKLANSLWLDNEVNGEAISYKEDFLTTAADDFYASSHSVDFADATAGEMMSAWVAENTNGLLTPQINPEAEQILSIINTVYFYDQWINRFDASKTAADTFYLADGTTQKVDFMNQTFASAGYARGENYTRSQLALKDNGSMIFVLPDEGVDLTSLVASPQALQAVLTGGESVSGEVVWQIPKFSFGFSADLTSTLKDLGITAAFSESADFSAITDAAAFISSVKQDTHIAVDENGVEAAAFTQIDYSGSAMPEGRAEMILNRPFIYAVTASNGMLLFVGVCHNPLG